MQTILNAVGKEAGAAAGGPGPWLGASQLSAGGTRCAVPSEVKLEEAAWLPLSIYTAELWPTWWGRTSHWGTPRLIRPGDSGAILPGAPLVPGTLSPHSLGTLAVYQTMDFSCRSRDLNFPAILKPSLTAQPHLL